MSQISSLLKLFRKSTQPDLLNTRLNVLPQRLFRCSHPELGPGQAAKAHRIDTVVAPPERSLLAGGVLGKVAQTTHRHCGVSCALVGVGWRNGTAGSWRAGPDIHGQRASVVPA